MNNKPIFSNCCGAKDRICGGITEMNYSEMGICPKCGEHCGFEEGEPVEAIAESKETLFRKAENLWQTLCSVKLQASAGFIPDPELIAKVLIENRPVGQ